MNRDILTGSEGVVYAYGQLSSATVTSTVTLNTAGGDALTDGTAAGLDFSNVGGTGVIEGEVFILIDPTAVVAADRVREYTAVSEVNPNQWIVTPAPPTKSNAFWVIRGRNKGKLLLSDIPGGILVPTTTHGEIEVANNQVHIGGMVDVFIKAGTPQEKSVIMDSVKDAEPKHFGVDLESFGGATANEEFMRFTDVGDGVWYSLAADAAADELLVLLDIVDGPTSRSILRWQPTEDDIGRYIQLYDDPGSMVSYEPLNQVLLKILEVKGNEVGGIGGSQRVCRLKVEALDYHYNTPQAFSITPVATHQAGYRLWEKVDIRDRVRDRALPVADFSAAGIDAKIGDSVVIESGSDAGTYTVRRVLTHTDPGAGTNRDSLVLDRPLLTATPPPSGQGDGSGLRYRLVDNLQVDLIDPKVQKIPLGAIFDGSDLNTVAGSTGISVGSNTNFLLAGVEAGDTLEILEGTDEGKKLVFDTVAGTTATLTTPVPTTASSLTFAVYRELTAIDRPLVRVKDIEVLDSSSQPTGNTVPYGDAVDCRVLGTLANRADGITVESYSGQTTTGTNVFGDLQADFNAEGVTPGHRLEILEGKDAGEYEIVQVDPNGMALSLKLAADGGSDFIATETSLHYRVGQTSAGLARVYFKDPTSVEILTGLGTGSSRIRYTADNGDTKDFRFSEVSGSPLFPMDPTEDPRDLRLVKSWRDNLAYSTLEITQSATPISPNAFDLELEVGDVVEVHEAIEFMNPTSGSVRRVDNVLGEVAGLHTVTGSNQVTLPDNSLIDFTKMGPSLDLVGQTLYIEDGPDTGKYLVEKVVDNHTLKLSSVMTTTTYPIKKFELGSTPFVAADRDSILVQAANGVWLGDTNLGAPLVGEWITIFEAQNPAHEGQWEIEALDLAQNPPRVRLKSMATSLGNTAIPVPGGEVDWTGTFSWILTEANSINGTIDQHFRVYNSIATDVQITDVATTGTDTVAYQPTGDVDTGALDEFKDNTTPFPIAGAGAVAPGAKLEVLEGINKGIYFVESVISANKLKLRDPLPASTAQTALEKYRIWPGIHGPKRMITVTGYQGGDGLLTPGAKMPYRIRRPNVHRVHSTAMEDQADSGLYYFDLSIESLGPGDDRNLVEDSRLEIISGMSVDGYTYTVGNNTLTFSPSEQVTMNFSRRFLPPGGSGLPSSFLEINGQSLKLTYDSSTAAGIVHDLLTSDLERPVNANPLGRHMLPSYVYTTLRYSGGSSVSVTGPELAEYINALGPLDVLEISDLEAILTRRGASYIQHPIVLVSLTHDIDRKLIVERSNDQVGGLVVPFNGTARISAFFASLDEGLVIVRS